MKASKTLVLLLLLVLLFSCKTEEQELLINVTYNPVIKFGKAATKDTLVSFSWLEDHANWNVESINHPSLKNGTGNVIVREIQEGETENYILQDEIEEHSWQVRQESEYFEAEKHQLKYTQEGTYLQDIDGMKAIGLEGAMPTTKLTAFSVTLDGEEVEIPEDAYTDVYNPIVDCIKAYVIGEKSLLIHTCGADGAARYDLYYLIENGMYVNRLRANPRPPSFN